MNKLRIFFPLLGLGLIGYWMFKSSTQIDTGSFKEIADIQSRNRHLALIGMACFWVYPAIKWIQSGTNIDYQAIIAVIKEQLLPSYGRRIPIWFQFVRIIAGGAFVYFMSTTVQAVKDELEINWGNFIFIILGAIIFFTLPLFFPRQNNYEP